MTSRHNILRSQLFMFEQTYLEVTLDDIPREKPENHQVGTPGSQKPSKPLKLRHSFSDMKKSTTSTLFYKTCMKEGQVKQDCNEIGARQGETGARHSRDRGETGRDRARQGETGARHSRDRGETGRDRARQGETGARHSRDRGETGARQRETLARQERDMTEDENRNMYFFLSKKYIFIYSFILSLW